MKKADFKPIWDAFTLSPVTETLGVNVTLPFVLRATINLDAGEGQVELDPADAPYITSVRKDNSAETYTIVDNVLTVTPNPDDVALLEITRSGTVEYSIFAGEIVPGINVVNGRLKGIVENIPYTSAHTYRFGIRGSWNGETADVVKTWVATPADNQITWNNDTLPVPEVDSSLVLGRAFYTIGEFRRGQMIEVGIDLYNPDFTALEVLSRPVPEMVADETHFAGLPLGLEITNNPFLISGFIPAEAVAGDYFIEVYVDEPFGPTPIILHAKLLGDQFDKFTAVNRLTWLTDSQLGTAREGLACTFKLKVNNSTGNTVTYNLAAGSRPLPVGITLSPTGELRGIVPHYDVDTDIQFSVKATSGPYVTTKRFTFRILNTFVEPRHLTVTLPLTGYVRRSWESYGNQIDSTRRFRPNDPQFGAASPRILLIRGLRALPITALDYDEPFELIVGPFKLAKVVQDGKYIYDVIYREFFDPLNKAGGFVQNDVDVIEEPAYYPQNPNIQIKEGTIRNLRSDLTMKIGLNTAGKEKILGLTGGELLDPWMSTVQTNGSQIGYIAAGVIDYILPGQGKVVMAGLQYSDIHVGQSIAFDRMKIQDVLYNYYYYLGWDHNERSDDVGANLPLPPYDVRVDGIPIEDDRDLHTQPFLTWTSAQPDVYYTIRFYIGNTLVRTVDEFTGNSIRYTSAMQSEDGIPGHVFIQIEAVRGNDRSPTITASIRLLSGWGLAWGFRYGG